MKFSILMSVYEKEKPEFLQSALSSLVTKSNFPSEIILVEDGPLTRGLYKVLDSFEENSNKFDFKRIKLKINSGLGIALNEGLKHCSNSWVGRMDSDDISSSERFNEIVEFIKQTDEEYDVIGGQINEFESNPLKPKYSRQVFLSHDDIQRDLKNRNPMNHVTVFFKKEKVLQCGGYDNFLYFEDYALWTKMLSYGMKFSNINSVHVKVRIGNDMIGRRHGWKYMRQEIRMQKYLFDHNFISKLVFLRNTCVRGFGRLLPKFILNWAYKINRK
jgi:glycosyltransferase involved in cell wall biosynthesis